MKLKIALFLIVILTILGAALYLRYGGLTHERIVEVVEDRSDEIKNRIDERCSALDRKLDRIESKLDKLLEIATHPQPRVLDDQSNPR